MIKSIREINNPYQKKKNVFKEKMDIYVPNIIDQNISKRNGMIYAMIGSGGSCKTNLLMNLFKSKNAYRNKFHNIYYFCPESSFLSIENLEFLRL